MKKFLAALSLFALMNCGTCSAENVHAVGRGISERMAVHDAMRAAIEKKFGAVVNSKTRVKNSVLLSDENAVDSAGLISSWKILSSRVVNGIFIVEISAELDDKKSARLTELEKKSLVDFNADNPRVAVIALDSSGRRYSEIENEIITALKRQGFTRTTDSAHADCLVIAEVKISPEDVRVSSRLVARKTGEIIFAGTTTGGGGFLSTSDALKLAGRRAGYDLSEAALKSAAQVERHITLLITPKTLQALGGTLTAACERIKNISGVNDAFARKLNSSLELDVDFDGTASDFAQVFESLGIKILELGAGFVKM